MLVIANSNYAKEMHPIYIDVTCLVRATKVGNINLISIHHHGVDRLVYSEGG
jgi:hypothetical protein